MKIKKLITTLTLTSTTILVASIASTVHAGLPGDIFLGNEINNELRELSKSVNHDAIVLGELPASKALGQKLYTFRYSSEKVIPYEKVSDDMVIEPDKTLSAHTARLNNNSRQDQTMKTASFTYTQNDSVSTSTTHATGVSLSTSANMKFTFVSASLSMTAKYDFNTTKAVQTSITKASSSRY